MPSTLPMAQPEPKPAVSERLRKLVAWAAVEVMASHPGKEALAPTVAYIRAGHKEPEAASVSNGFENLDDLFESTRTELAAVGEVEAYVLLVDYFDDLPELPNMRPLDTGGDPYPEGTPTMIMYLGEKDVREGVLVIQPYYKRRFRGGAATVGAPLILEGPDSLLFDAS